MPKRKPIWELGRFLSAVSDRGLFVSFEGHKILQNAARNAFYEEVDL
ncbi:MAG: hypothetical protein NC299_10760 [Lachnospiraceae bacterium]|nr:hypothetical protein [Ruminococcus sp.]MCM1275828.1 hypothetical protein [Lachnospiraceae bacterium]